MYFSYPVLLLGHSLRKFFCDLICIFKLVYSCLVNSLSYAVNATVLRGNKSVTRKLCYCKDDLAMHPIYGWPKNFWDSLTTTMAIFPKNFSSAFVPIDPVNMHTKFEARSFTRFWEAQKIGQPLAMPTLSISPRPPEICYMVSSERALVISYRRSMHIIPLSALVCLKF